MKKDGKSNTEWISIKIAVIYTIFSGLWILLSDQILYFLVRDPEVMTKIQIIKGWIFILTSALIIFFLLRREIKKYLQTAKALQKSEEKLHLIIDTSHVGICTVDPLGNFVTTNPAYELMVGYSKEELRGLSFFDVTHPDNRPKNKKLFQEMFSLKTRNFFMEKKYIRKDGAMIEVAVHATGIMDAEGNAIFGTAFVEDITERKHAVDELRQYEQIVSSTKDMLALIDKNFVFLSANLAYMQAFAKTSDQLIGRTVTDVFGEEFFSKVIKPRAERCMAGENIRYQDWFDYPATGQRYMDIAYSAFIVPDAGVQGFVVTARDITKYESLQGQLAQAQKMESVGRLAGGVAHDYNNISSIIIGYSELALEQVEQSDPLHDDLMEILTAAKRSTYITRQLLAFARKQTIAPRVLDLNEVIENMLKMLQRLIGEDINLAWLPGAKIWPIKIDPSQVDQILANLCVNARDAIANVGKVTIETKNINFDEDYCSNHSDFLPGEYVLLAVSDDGSGIAPKTLDKIFEPFFTTKGLSKGTGLGLATVYGIVKQNNGFINVYSEPDKGTTIKIYLSRHTGQAVEAPRKAALEIQLSRGETILLVEDDGPILKFGKRILEELGYAVLSFASPTEATKLAEEQVSEIDLLITDVVMPGMNGRELSEYLQHLYPNLKTLFMSGYTANVIAHRGVLEDGVSFISKPFSKKDLAAKVRDILDECKEQSLS
jgi:PAS domain S-box-containing protein